MEDLREVDVYCFVAKLKYVDKDDYYLVPFKVFSKDFYSAKEKLMCWLNNPKQTGYKYDEYVGIIDQPSEKLIVDIEFIRESVAS